MELDIRTFWLIAGLCAAGVGNLVVFVRRAYPREMRRLLRYYSLANLCLATSFFIRYEQRWTGDFPFYVVSSVLILLCLSLEYFTFCTMKNRKPLAAILYGPAALAAAECVWFTFVQRNISVEMMLNNILDGIMLAAIVWTLLGREQGRRLIGDVLCAIGYGTVFLVTLLAVGDALRTGNFTVEYDFNRGRSVLNVIAAICAEGVIFPMFLLMLSERINRRLSVQAMHDPLTGLYNRRAFEDIAYREIAGAARTKAPFSILLCDLDLFKEVNDRYGHGTGDAVLRAAAARLRRGLREEDFLCRWGGDEFCALLPRASREDAVAVAERVRQRFEESTGYEGAPALRITVSIGIVNNVASDAGLAALIHLADGALYRAKESGRNRVAVAGIPADSADGQTGD